MARKVTGKKTERADRRLQNALERFILITPFLIGLFFPWTSAAAVLWLLVLLIQTQRRSGLTVCLSPCLLLSCSIPLLLAAGALWGVDRGMSLPGVLQFLPLPLFVLLLEQIEAKERFSLLRYLPEAAAVMTALSVLLSRIPRIAYFFLVNGRLGGFFQYPNTFALYLLIAMVVLLFGKSRPAVHQVVLMFLLMGGILLSGSRTVMALTLVVLLFFFFRRGDRKLRLAGLAAVILAFGGGGLYALITGNTGGIGRFWSSSLSSSELLGRFLYAGDAIPVILRHPLGLGYMGYYRLQGSFQTGVYTVSHAHNELLQLLLDTGWIPAGLLIWALIRAFREREDSLCRKILFAVLCLHCLLDFDTQFTAMSLLLFLILDIAPRGERVFRKQGPVLACSLLLAAFSVWLGTANGFVWNRNPFIGAKLYPAYTTALIRCLPQTGGAREEELADRILKLCDASPEAWDVKARQALAVGNVNGMIEAKRKAIHYARYSLKEYQDYIILLERAALSPATSPEDVARCREEMAAIPEMLESVKANTSALGWKIRDVPNLELTGEWMETIARIARVPVS